MDDIGFVAIKPVVPEVDVELVVAWADALESGQYQQGKHYLHPKGVDGQDTFCCLGVLCDVAMERGVFVGRWDTSYGPKEPAYSLVIEDVPGDQMWHGHRENLSLPRFLAQRAGLMTNGGELRDGDWLLPPASDHDYVREDGTVHHETLSTANDEDQPFVNIAQAIRRQLLPRIQGQNTTKEGGTEWSETTS